MLACARNIAPYDKSDAARIRRLQLVYEMLVFGLEGVTFLRIQRHRSFHRTTSDSKTRLVTDLFSKERTMKDDVHNLNIDRGREVRIISPRNGPG